MSDPVVSVGFVSCNRLHYLRACVESFLESTESFAEKELMVVDNASVEDGMNDYLDELEARGFRVVRHERRDPSNEFARALNEISAWGRGKLVFALQGDMQFIAKGRWLERYVSTVDRCDGQIGCMMLDAQRRIRNASARFTALRANDGSLVDGFLVDVGRPPVCCAGDVVYPRKVLDKLGPWSIDNVRHEGGGDSETRMLERLKGIVTDERLPWACIVPIVPPAAGIFTDKRGTCARVRENRRYGDYWPPKDGKRYYEMRDESSLSSALRIGKGWMPEPLGIEELARPVGFDAPVDGNGDWLKNPIRPETAAASDYVELVHDELPFEQESKPSPELDGWLAT